jgi:hypothetical protein
VAGGERASKLREKADDKLISNLDAARSYVTSRDFETLLSDVYKEYPEFSSESRFKK